MSTEQLIIELDARTAKLDAKLKKVEKQLDGVEDSTKKADFSFKKFAKTADKVGNKAGGLAVAGLALSTAITAIALASAKGRRELELLSKQAKTSTADFQSLSFATSRYGINAEQIADISKDIADKVGEFSAAGTGAFQDYADVMKLTKFEARLVAQEFEGLSSQEILGTMVSRMEEAGVTGDKMTFVLESLGNDASRLIPLFAGNSKELRELKKRFDDVNDSLQITGAQAEALGELSTSFTLMTSSIGNATTAISATLAPVLDDFFNDVIDVVPDATQTIIDFVNSFLDAKDITSKAGFLQQISEAQANILEAQASLRQAEEDAAKFTGGLINTAEIRAASFKAIIKDEQTRTEELNEQLAILLKQKEALADAHRIEGGTIDGEAPTVDGKDFNLDFGSGLGTGDEIQAIEDRFKTEELLLSEKLVNELQIIGDNNELKIQLEQEFADNINEIREKASKDKLKIDEQRQKTEQSLERKNISSIMSIVSALVGHNSDVGKALFIASQGLAASEVFFNTQVASMRALAELGPIAGPPVAAGIQASGNLSIAAIAATTFGSLASSSGGGSGGGAGSISAPSTSSEQQPDFQPETSSLELSDSTEGGSQSINITVPDGDEIGQAIANWLTKAQSEGRA
jgi:hypothetical protein